MKKEKTEKYKTGGMWDFPDWKIISNRRCSSGGGCEPCKHCEEVPFELWERKNEKEWICPRVIVAENEGRYNSTGVCADCVLEALTKIT